MLTSICSSICVKRKSRSGSRVVAQSVSRRQAKEVRVESTKCSIMMRFRLSERAMLPTLSSYKHVASRSPQRVTGTGNCCSRTRRPRIALDGRDPDRRGPVDGGQTPSKVAGTSSQVAAAREPESAATCPPQGSSRRNVCPPQGSSRRNVRISSPARRSQTYKARRLGALLAYKMRRLGGPSAYKTRRLGTPPTPSDQDLGHRQRARSRRAG